MQKAGPVISAKRTKAPLQRGLLEMRYRGGMELSGLGVAGWHESSLRLCRRSLPPSAAAVGDNNLPGFLADPEG